MAKWWQLPETHKDGEELQSKIDERRKSDKATQILLIVLLILLLIAVFALPECAPIF